MTELRSSPAAASAPPLCLPRPSCNQPQKALSTDAVARGGARAPSYVPRRHAHLEAATQIRLAVQAETGEADTIHRPIKASSGATSGVSERGGERGRA